MANYSCRDVRVPTVSGLLSSSNAVRDPASGLDEGQVSITGMDVRLGTLPPKHVILSFVMEADTWRWLEIGGSLVLKRRLEAVGGSRKKAMCSTSKSH